MKKYIGIQEISLSDQQMWDRKGYPGNGYYVVTNEHNQKWLVAVANNYVPTGILLENDVETIEMPESNQLDSISSNTLLKAIAIAQDANLAKELIKD